MKKILFSMNRFKKGIIFVLTLSLMLAFSNSIYATSINTIEEEYAMNKVKSTSIMIGTDKGFEEDKTLTRAEAITIMVRLKGLTGDQIKAFLTKDGEKPVFSDVPNTHWANEYVNAAFNLGITEGIGDELFNPSSEVTVAELYTMCTRALDAGNLVEADKDNEWPINYVNFANDIHLSDNVNTLYSEKATRKTCAMIISNCLASKCWEKSSVTSFKINSKTNDAPEVTYIESNTKLIDKLGYKEVSGVTITEVDTKDNKIKTLEAIDNKTRFDVIKGISLISIKRGLKYTIWIKETTNDSKDKGKITGYSSSRDTGDVIYFTNIKKVETSTITITLKNEFSSINKEDKELKLDCLMNPQNPSNFFFDFYYNDIKQNDYSKLVPDVKLSGLVIKNKDGKISKMYIEDYAFFGVIKEINDKKITFESTSKVKGTTTNDIYLNDEDDEIIIKDYNDTPLKISSLKKGDGLAIHKERRSELFSESSNGDRYTLMALSSISNVNVQSISTSESLRNGIKVYNVTLKNELNNSKERFDVLIKGYTISLGDEGTFYLNSHGEVIMFMPNSSLNGNYVYVNSTRKARSKYVGEDPIYELKVQTMDGNQTDWLELDFDESAANIAGLKAWTLTEDVCNFGGLVIFKDSDIEGINTDNLDDDYWEANKDKKVYVLDKWIFDDSVLSDELLGYSGWGFYDLDFNYYIFENRKDAEDAAIKLVRKACEDREDGNGIYSLFNGMAFKARINETDKKITLLGTGKNYDKEWMDFITNDDVLTSEIELISSYTNTKRYDYLTTRDTNRLYLSNDSKVFLSEWNGEFGRNQEFKLKQIDKDNLESIEDISPDVIIYENQSLISPLYAFTLGVDSEERETSFVIIPERLTSLKTDNELWALVLSSGETTNDKDVTLSDNENIDSFVDVIFEGTDKVRTLYFDSSMFNGNNEYYANLKGLTSPRIFKLDLEGSEIKKARGNNSQDEDSYFTDNSDGKQGLLTYKEGILTKIVNDTRIRLSSSYIWASVGSAASFTELDEDYFLSDKVLLLEKEEGTDNYKIVDHIEDFNETELDLETVPDTEEKKLELNTKNLEDYTDNALTFITYDKEGDVTILAIIKG